MSRIDGGQKRTICRFIVKVRRCEKNVTIMRMRIDWFWVVLRGSTHSHIIWEGERVMQCSVL